MSKLLVLFAIIFVSCGSDPECIYNSDCEGLFGFCWKEKCESFPPPPGPMVSKSMVLPCQCWGGDPEMEIGFQRENPYCASGKDVVKQCFFLDTRDENCDILTATVCE